MASTTSSSSSQPPLAKANRTFSLNLLKQLVDEDKKANIFCSPLSITAAMAMVWLGAQCETAKQISKALGFTEGDEPEEEGEPPKEEGEPPKEEGEPPKEEGEQPKEEGEQPMEQVQTRMKRPMQYTRSQVQTRQMLTQQQQNTRIPDYLQLLNEDKEVHTNLGQLLKDLKEEKAGCTINLANRLYGERTFTFKLPYRQEIKKIYKAELESVNFKAKAEEARVNINSWVDEETKGKIKELLEEGMVDDSTILVLVNAIYFKGTWAQKFNESDTVEEQFKITEDEAKPVKMMRLKSRFPFRDIPEAKLKVLEIPYEKDEISMIILLPYEIMGLEELEKNLTKKNFKDWTSQQKMEMGEVTVNLPRFNLEESYDLNEVLFKMGIKDAFDVSKSDFRGMSTKRNLILSKTVHKAYVVVNEEGTEAAASTAAVLSERSGTIPSEFLADHPFLFFIKHKSSETILFLGRVCNPE